jgi:uncharacterized RDD family membrane protein YckC
MYCPKCGKESMDDDDFCISCGEELKLYKNRENLHNSVKSNSEYGKGDMSYSYSAKPVENSEIQLASLGNRIGAYIIDTLVVSVLIVIIMIPIVAVQYDYFTYDDSSVLVSSLLGILIFFGYFILLEGPLGKGRTVGKRALKLRVIKKDQSMISYGASFGRNVLRLIDGFFFYIIGMILISSSDLNQRLGDRAADTIVIKGNDYENKSRPPTSLGYS